MFVLIVGIMFIGGVIWSFIFSQTKPSLVLTTNDPQREKCKSPVERWLYDSLKMRGFTVETRVPCGPYELELALPTHKIAIECEQPTAVQKILHKQKTRYLKRNGWRTIHIRPQYIYEDFNRKLRKINVYKHN